ncbi:PREDICTED: mediator of DNA damage checkpoint protein 1-like [Dinoponera quadriceps]|uniref:Mediator of DNA damage checkpoint protein 1 n=1 Tax=Dinoponera quadriceps TaxID=609295 RepID=A0A6P3XGZ3_DINQU|nr:PREDICTED: mediator of DNA damage checkpoint protein 1-like [Dinoponera quadriceps]
MDLAATQIYDEEEIECTQRISPTLEGKNSVQIQVGVLSIDSTEYEIKSGTTKIGRQGICDICIDNAMVSNIHAEIEADGGQGSTWICDLQSKNKTKLNNLELRPNRMYELRDGSVIEFGKVRAVYRTYRPMHDVVIPETPVPTLRNVARSIIPNTPDSSINNSSSNDDGSVILGTQTEKGSNVFRRPLLPQQHQSTSIDKKNTSCGVSRSESDDSQIDFRLHVSANDSSGRTGGVSIFDMETQKNEESRKAVASSSIHDMETQNVSTNVSKYSETHATTDKPLKFDLRDKMTGSYAVDISDMETQIYMNANEQRRAENSESDAAAKKSTTNIHDLETQNYIIVIAGNTRDAPAKKCTTSIHDLETRDNLVDAAKISSVTRKAANDKTKSRTADMDRIERDIHDLETQKLDNERTVEDISDMETQIAASRADKKDGNENSDAPVKSNTNSRASSPGLLYLSSPGINEDCPSSPLNQSVHVLESSNLLEYFGEGIDQPEGIQQHNASTPKPCSKTLHKNTGSTDASDNGNDNEINNIHDLPTQRNDSSSRIYSSDDSETNVKKEVVKRKVSKKARKKSQPKQIKDDSETDAEEYLEELARKQSGSSNKMRDGENRNDSDATVDSDDIFDMLTQPSNDHSAKNTNSNLPTNQPSKTIISDAVADDTMAATQKAEDKCGRDDRSHISSADDAAQLLLPRKASPKATVNSKEPLVKNNRNDAKDTAPTHVVHVNIDTFDAIESDNRCRSSPNLDCEDLNYETAPTQVIGEVAAERNPTSRTSESGVKAAESAKVDLNDTLERNLEEMFEDVNNDSIHEGPLMSTQCLEDMLQSSGYDEDLASKNEIIVNEQASSADTSSKSGRKSNRFSRIVKASEVKKNNADETDSQNSDAYFAGITSKRKRNIIKDTQDLIDSAEALISSCEVPDSPRKSKEKAKDEAKSSVPAKSDKGVKKIAKSKSQAGDVSTDKDTVSRTTSGEKRTVQKTKLVKQEDGTFALETRERKVPGKDSCEVDVDHTVGNIASGPGVRAPCPSSSRQDESSVLYVSDDDILTRLPAVRISGTLSNPPSPSASSTSTVRSVRSKRGVAKGSGKDGPTRSKSLRKRNEPSRAINELPSDDNHSSNVNLETLTNNKKSESANNSEDSDSATSYRRFKQIADRMFGTQSHQKKRDEGNSPDSSKVSIVSVKKKGIGSPSPAGSKHNSGLEESGNPVQTNSTRCSDKLEQSNRVTRAKSATGKPETRAAANRKRGLKTTEACAGQTDSKKRKADDPVTEVPASRRSKRATASTARADKHSPSTIEEMEAGTRENSPVIGESSLSRKAAASGTEENVEAAGSSVTRNRRKVNNSQPAKSTMDGNSNRDKRAQKKRKEILAVGAQDKTLKIVLNPIIVDEESREVEMIMTRKPPGDMRDDNLSIREGSNVSILRRASIISRKRANTIADTSSSIESSASDTSDRESVQSDGITLRRSRRGRSAKDAVPPQPASEKSDVFKRPARVKRYSTNSNVVVGSATIDDIRDSSGSDAPLNIRLSRSKTAGVKNTWEVRMNEDTRSKSRTEKNSVSSAMNTSVNSSLRVSTPSRARRSASSMSVSSPSAAKHRILFTGITEDKYSKVVKTLGGCKVDEPDKCTVLVTDKIRRTYKFLCALAKGVPIVSIDWLNNSESEAQFLNWENYILKDPATEAKFGFRLRKSLDRAKEKGLLVGYTIVLTPNIAPPPTEELKDMVISCGGRVLLRPPKIWPEKAMIISRVEDLPNAKKYLAKAPKTVTVQSTEFILTGILRQEVDFDKYRLT